MTSDTSSQCNRIDIVGNISRHFIVCLFLTLSKQMLDGSSLCSWIAFTIAWCHITNYIIYTVHSSVSYILSWITFILQIFFMYLFRNSVFFDWSKVNFLFLTKARETYFGHIMLEFHHYQLILPQLFLLD